MSQPIWITPAGSLGTIPEGIFYQNTMLVTTDPLPITPTCTATTAGTNVITCTSTEGIYPELFVMFTGTVFGGISSTVEYYVLDVISGTQFRITAAYQGTSPVELTTATGSMTTVFRQSVYYIIIAGSLPPGIQCSANGLIVGVPQALASLQGVPFEVNQNVTSKFTIRAYTENQDETVDRIRDRTFTLTITGNQVPEFTTPAGSIGSYYDGDLIDFQILYTNNDPGDTVVIKLVGGELPPGVTVSSTGLLRGNIKPINNIDALPGYDITSSAAYPYDFVVSAGNNKNYQFTLEVTDGKGSNLRTFQVYVYNRNTLTADTTQITADNTFVTADETTERPPFLINDLPSDLGTVRGDNYYAHQFIGNDYDTPNIKYAINVNQGYGLPPGLTLDTNSGWYYGYIPDQGVTNIDYSFNIVVYQTDFVGSPISCTATTFGTNIVTCASTAQINAGQPLLFTGTSFGGITASETQVYYVLSIESDIKFTLTANPDSTTPVTLTSASGTLVANLIVASIPYPFSLNISGAINSEVTWITPADLGSIDNGSTSMLVIQATNIGGRTLQYRLKNGAYNLLPQGLKLLPTGEISGRVTFNTFAVDLGATTFDATQTVIRNVTIQETTFDTQFTFNVNAYAEDTNQIVYDVSKVTVTNGGSGYSSINPPVLEFSTPVGSSAVAAEVESVTVVGGVITKVVLSDTGAGYTSPAILTIVAGYGGSGAVLTPVMRPTGIKDVVSVFKTFTVHVNHEYNAPYQNLFVQAMPPANDRVVITDLLSNEEIFVPEYIYRFDDPYFGKADSVVYQHAFGLAPDRFVTYVESLYLNHYWKNLVLGEINVAQALDPVTGDIVYEVVYSKIIDDLVNASGASVSKIVNTAYPITDPTDGSTQIRSVYPNSLINMRDQVIDVVGQISTKLPLWMTSKQTDGRALGFTPAWVICYANPGRGAQIAYYIQTYFQYQLNAIDFKVDRYVLDHTLSRNWDTTTQNWTPTPTLTTFDRYGSGILPFAGYVEFATQLAYTDVNNRTLEYISALGGIDGRVSFSTGDTVVFVKQQYYSDYATPDEGWQDYTDLYGDVYSPETSEHLFDESYTIPGGYDYECTNTYVTTNYIKAASTVGMTVDDPVWFSGATFGGIDANGSNGLAKIYYVKSVVGITCTATTTGTNIITCSSTSDLTTNDIVWFTGNTFGGVESLDVSNNIQPYYVTVMTGTEFKISLTLGGGAVTLSTASGSMTAKTRYFTVSESSGGAAAVLTSAAGTMTATFGNQRMSVYTISVDLGTRLVTLTQTQMTAETQYIQIVGGRKYAGQQFYYPSTPAVGYTLINWLPVGESEANETTFDETSLRFIAPVDMYDPTDRDDKYLVFPKANILV